MRVLVADDSAVARRAIAGIVASDPDLEVVGEAADGPQAVAMVERTRPDVVTMDVHMPGLDGFEATRRIMERSPVPIVIVTSDYEPAHVSRSFEAIEAGALTVVGKPVGPAHPDATVHARAFTRTLKTMAQVRVVGRRRGVRPLPPTAAPVGVLRRADVVAVAASTGGPAALAAVLGALPGDLRVPILVVQHITPGFEAGLAAWLDRVTPLRVVLARAAAPLCPGDVVIAPADRHLAVRADRVALDDGPPVGGHRPSANVLFASVAAAYGARSLAVVLTGMGADGTDGLRSLKAAGGSVLAQDEATSVVYGMPAQAVAAGVVDRTAALDEVAPLVLAAAGRRRVPR